ncbi:protein kinase domain-containing protein [Planotetraspora sp. GP83]|uniref:protein kinase domain-containing protein n=1 Tax=Planotetraspora sp. GP83 TaxID=3156264 RepID=UPI003516F2FF
MAQASALLPGDPPRLGDFWLAGRLGAGGQGVVYEAYDGEGRRVAVKVLHGDAAGDPDLRVSLGKEAVAAQRVASFCTARVLTAVLDGPKPYIVSEYVEGPSLRRAVMDGRRFVGDDLHRLATAVATALAAIHDAGVIHRDLKPDNVLLGPDGPRVIDFGLARTEEMSLTASGLVRGTPTYMAPEVFTGQRAGAPADVFSWGAIVVYAASGEDPFKGDSLGAVMHSVLSADPDLGALPGSLRALVAAALSKDPSGRPTAKELLLGLVSGFHGSQADLLTLGSAEAGLLSRNAAPDPALGTLAEDAYGILSPPERNLLPDVFLRMVTAGEGGEVTVRPVPGEELFEGRPPEEEAALHRILEVFGYLVVSRGDEIVLARPALLRAWPRLRAWVDDEREGLAVHGQIRTAARQWQTHGRRDGDVFQGSRLETALRWAATGRRHLTLNRLERDFLDACNSATRHRARRRRLVSGVLAGLLAVAVVAGATAVQQSRAASAQRDLAVAGHIAAGADTLRTSDPVRAMLLSVAAWRLAPSMATRSALENSWAQRERSVFTDPQTSGQTVRLLAQDGRRLVSVTPTSVRIYDLRTRKRIGGWDDRSIGGGEFLDAALSPSGRFLAVVAGGAIQVWDTTTGRPASARFNLVDPNFFTGVDFAFGDRYVIVGQGDGATFWDTRTGARFTPSEGAIDAAFSPAGDMVATVDTQTRFHLLRLPGGAPVTHWEGYSACPKSGQAVAISPDGRTLACAGRTTIEFVDLRTGRSLLEAPPWGWDWNGGRILFSPDGRFLVAGGPKSFQLIRVSNGESLLTYRTSADAVGFDGTTLRYLVDDTVVGLDVSDLTQPVRLPQTTPETAMFSPDGRLVATHEADSHVLALWDVSRRRPAGPPLRLTAGDNGHYPAFSRDGRLIAAIDGANAETVRLWETARHTQVAKIDLPDNSDAGSVAMNADGSLLGIGASMIADDSGSRERLLVWDVRRRHWLRAIDLRMPADVVFRPGSAMVAQADGSANRLIDLSTGQATGPVFGSGGLGADVRALAFSPDGATMAVGDYSGRIAFWDLRTGRRRGPIFRAHLVDGVGEIVFSPRGDVAASIGRDHAIQLWDAATPRKLGQPITGGGADILSAAFGSGGSVLRTLDVGGVLREISIDPERAAATVCARAGRTLTEAEWARDLPGVPYRDVCHESAP